MANDPKVRPRRAKRGDRLKPDAMFSFHRLVFDRSLEVYLESIAIIAGGTPIPWSSSRLGKIDYCIAFSQCVRRLNPTLAENFAKLIAGEAVSQGATNELTTALAKLLIRAKLFPMSAFYLTPAAFARMKAKRQRTSGKKVEVLASIPDGGTRCFGKNGGSLVREFVPEPTEPVEQAIEPQVQSVEAEFVEDFDDSVFNRQSLSA